MTSVQLAAPLLHSLLDSKSVALQVSFILAPQDSDQTMHRMQKMLLPYICSRVHACEADSFTLHVTSGGVNLDILVSNTV